MVPADSEMNSSTETPFTNAFPEGWPSCSPTCVVETLQELDKARCPNEKGFYSSYPAKWERLDIEKRQKTFVFFGKLKEEVKNEVAPIAVEKEKSASEQPKLRGSVTTKHDKARVLHLFADPRLVLDLRKAYGSGHRRVDEEKTTVVK